ncbi:MAG TPA: nickel pincer cofactor biosynthesis protein LarC [Chloroflexota bacterium]|nr:nickel pincer cofactor biosynthesis protein LarC [Chloroflexota bacterium]
MKVAFADCFSGISGDMFLGALLDAGLALDELSATLAGLPVTGYQVSAEKVTRGGITGTAVRVRLSDPASEPHRHIGEIEAIIQEGNLPGQVQAKAIEVFRVLAAAEAEIHGVPIEAVHFHEVGAVDSIVDVVGTVWGLDRLGITRLFASSLPTGSGTVQTAHGLLPVPAPATLALLARCRAPLRPSSAATELVTPTGAALLASLASFDQPNMRLDRVGYGFGQKTLPWANVLRLWIGDLDSAEKSDSDNLEDTIEVIEANLDDEIPEILGATVDMLLAAGALDVFFTPIQMKKNRPAVKLTVLARPEIAAQLAAQMMRETSTLGVRIYSARRLKCRRWQQRVATPWGNVLVKVKEFAGERRASPEYEDCLRVARAAGVPLTDVYRLVNAAATLGGLTGDSPTDGLLQSPSTNEPNRGDRTE